MAVPHKKCKDEVGFTIEYSNSYRYGQQTNNHRTAPKGSGRSIMAELASFTNIPDDVKREADRIFQKLNITTRAKRRSKIIFGCVWTAFNMVGNPKDPKHVATLIGFDHKQISKAKSEYSKEAAKKGIKPIQNEPEDFIKQYFIALDIDHSYILDVTNLMDEILDDNDIKGFPQEIAAGFIYYFMQIRGKTYELKDFSKMVEVSYPTLRRIYEEIYDIHNS